MSLSHYQMPATPSDEAAREAEIVRSGVLFLSSDPRLTGVVEHARALFGTGMAALTIIYADWQYVIAAAGMEPGVYRRSTSFCGHAILHPGTMFCVPDASRDDRFLGNPTVTGGDAIRFYAGFPIVSAGLPLGALCVFDPAPRACLDPRQARLLESMADDAMATVRDLVRQSRPSAARA